MSDAVTRLNAALEGRYRIEHELGEGGMATVYLADDLRHERKIALKVLKPELAAVVGAERFLAEIKTTANLQHPHILPLFDSGEAASFLFYVMPYVEGETLRDKLDREHQLPVDDAVRIATNVAEALQYAHSQGVVHRDIKPANILLQAGKPVISDFGIALAVNGGSRARFTETGLSLGTPHYMSPEQATGDLGVGGATDIYALGCVLYEMLVGEPPYTGGTPQAVLGNIIAGELASATKHRRSVLAHVDAAIRKALERVPADRFKSAQDFARALADPGFRHGGAVAGQPGTVSAWSPMTTAFASLAAVMALVAAWSVFRSERPGAVTRLGLDLPEGQSLAPAVGPRVTLAPDGRSFAYVGEGGDGRSRIWIRDLSRLAAAELPGTEDGHSPTFSPDGQMLAFRQGTATRVARLDGGPNVTLAETVLSDYAGTLAWGPDGFIYLGHRGLLRVPATGGAWEIVTPQDTLGRWHLNPDVLPNGRGAVFSLGLNETRTTNVIAVADFGTGEVRELTSGVMARYIGTGHLAVVRSDGVLDVAPFDQDRLDMTGPATTVGVDVGISDWGATDLSLSGSGTLLYTTGAQEPRRQVVWVDREGFERPVDPSWVGPYESVALSPDGRRLAVGTGFGAEPHLWIKALDSGPLTKLTLGGSLNRRPIWSADGETITFISDRGGNRDVYRKRSDGVGAAQLVLDLPDHVDEVDLSPGGDWLVYRTGISGGEGRDISAWHVAGDSVSLPIAASPAFDEMTPSLSPDGRWLAYVSDESGQREVYVRSFPDVEALRLQVSTNGGRSPVWSHNGGELFYEDDLAKVLMVLDVTTRPSFEVTPARPLFSTARYFVQAAPTAYDITADDQTFVMIREDEAPAQGDLILVQNFFEELKRLPPD